MHNCYACIFIGINILDSVKKILAHIYVFNISFLKMCVHVLWLLLRNNSFETSLKLLWLKYRGIVMRNMFVGILAGLGHRKFTMRAVGAHLK